MKTLLIYTEQAWLHIVVPARDFREELIEQQSRLQKVAEKELLGPDYTNPLNFRHVSRA